MIRIEGRTRQRSERQDRLDRAMEWLLIALLAFAPFAFGAVEAWSEEIVVVLAAAIAICFCVKMAVARNMSVTWTWAYVPVLAVIAVAVVQIIPLPVRLVGLISPNTVAQKTELLADLYGTDTLPSFMPISFYPCATRHDLRLVLAAAVVFVVVLNVFRRPGQITRLLFAVAIIGAAVASLALAQDIVGNSKIYWFVASPHSTSLSGPFVNHSHYAQFMNLSIGAALAMIFIKAREAFGGRKATPAAVAEYLGSPDGKLIWGLCAVIALGAATIFASLSRGGMVSLMIAGAFTTVVLSSRRALKGSGWVMVVMALGAFICVLCMGFDAVYERLGTLRDLNQAGGSRWQVVRNVAVAWTRFPVTGTGLGTHEVVYPMFDRSTSTAIASHAENEYAQAAEETGAIGLGCLVAFAVLVWRSYAKSVRSARAPIRSAAYGLGFGLVAIMAHSLSDFGQHLPANAFLSVVFCALMIRLAHVGVSDGAAVRESTVTEGRSRLYGAIAWAAVCLVAAWAILGADAARRGEAHWAKAMAVERGLVKAQWQGSDDEYKDLLENAAFARDCQPDNINYGYWLDVYRWRAISRATDPNTGEIIRSPEILGFADRITADLKRTLASCPTFGPAWCVLGQLEMFSHGRDEEVVRHIERGYRLAPYHPTVCFVAGVLHMDEGNTDAAFSEWKRAIELDGQMFVEASSLLVRTFDRPDLACELAGDDTGRLAQVEQTLRESNGSDEQLSSLSDRIFRLLEQECQRGDAPAWKFAWLGEKYRTGGRMNEAIEMYRKAIALQYGQAEWHLTLAEMLSAQGLASEAARELEICLRLRPQFEPAKRLLGKIPIQAGTGTGAP